MLMFNMNIKLVPSKRIRTIALAITLIKKFILALTLALTLKILMKFLLTFLKIFLLTANKKYKKIVPSVNINIFNFRKIFLAVNIIVKKIVGRNI